MNDLREMITAAQQAQQAKREEAETERLQRHQEAVAEMLRLLQGEIEAVLPALAGRMQYCYGPNSCFSHSTEFASLPIDGYEFHFHHGYIDHDYRLMCAISCTNPHNEDDGCHLQTRWETRYKLKEGPLQELVLSWLGDALSELEARWAEWQEAEETRRFNAEIPF